MKKILLFKFISILILFFIALFLLSTNVKALESSSYSDVLDDLKKDESFDESQYIEIMNDYEPKLITVAESKDNELFIYLYQPCKSTIDVCSINISRYIGNDTWNNYELVLLNSNGIFYKYLVKNFKVINDVVRYYDISEVHRYANYELGDHISDSSQILETIAYPVSKRYSVSTINNEQIWSCIETDVVVILPEQKHVGYLRLDNSDWFYRAFYMGVDYVDSHYIAFSCNHNIDNLYESDISWCEIDYTEIRANGGRMYNGYHSLEEMANSGDFSSTSKMKTVSYTDTGSTHVYGKFATDSSWKRIEKVSDFISENDLTQETINNIQDKDWIIRFIETDYNELVISGDKRKFEGTYVNSVQILRLKFEEEGIVYNLGVVDGKSSSVGNPDNPVNYGLDFSGLFDETKTFLQKILAIASLVLILIVLMPILPFVIKIVVWIIKQPFLLLKRLFGKRR